MDPTAGWHPDPTARHQLRYWDGNAWTHHVSDDGVTGVDPMVSTPPVASWAAASTDPVPTQAADPTGGGTVVPAEARRRPWALLVLGVVVAGAVVVALLAFVGGDDGGSQSAYGTRVLAIDADDPIVALRFDMEEGEAFRYRVVPRGPDVNLRSAVVTDEDTALALLAEFGGFTDEVGSDELSDLLSEVGGEFSDVDVQSELDLEGDLWVVGGFGFSPGPGLGSSGAFVAGREGTYYLVFGGAGFGGIDEDTFGEFSVTAEQRDDAVDASDTEAIFTDEFLTDEDFRSDDLDYTDVSDDLSD